MNNDRENENKLNELLTKLEFIKEVNIKKLFLIFGITLVVLGMLAVKATEYIDKPGFCKSCHTMKPYYNYWVESSHKDVSCFDCHFGYTPVTKPKTIPTTTRQYWNLEVGGKTINVSKTMNYIKDQVIRLNTNITNFNTKAVEVISRSTYIRKVYIMAVGGSTSDVSKDFWKNCLKCHGDLLKSSLKKDSYGHDKHLKEGMACNQCHRNLVHARQDQISRRTCEQCHDNSISWPNSHWDKSFPVTHGQTYLKTGGCELCHKKGVKEPRCLECHKMEMPHPEGYTMYHIKEINQVGIDVCLNCHKDPPNKTPKISDNNGYTRRSPNFKPKNSSNSTPNNKADANPLRKAMSCNECHGPDLPHRGYQEILRTHGNLASKKGTNGCLSCHQSKKCTDCHGMTIPHPGGFIQKHTSIAKSSGVDKCLKCHKEYEPDSKAKSCIGCHTVEMPHPETWNNDHGSYKDKNCSLCHSSKNPANPKAPYARDNFCQRCHNVKPHASNHSQPEIWNWTEKECFACHDGGKGCTTCHQRNGGVS